jgi:electron transfer flavoprotein beta subunit
MNARDIFASASKEIKMWTAADIDVDKSKLGLGGSPTKVKKSMTKELKGAGEIVNKPADEAVAYVIGKLKEKHYI